MNQYFTIYHKNY